MITGVSGTLVKAGVDWADVLVGNAVTLRLFVPASALEGLGRVGKPVKLYTSLQVREDSLTLYGFPTEDARLAFESLLAVNGVGPKIAMAVLSRLSPEQLAVAVERADLDAFDRIPGVGKKTAGRIVLELKGKLAAEWAVATAQPDTADVVSALTALGYSAAEARDAVASLPSGDALTLEDKVRLALERIGKG
ncbi:MAG: Holliday junction branch migration protein RuvA [SAR202 cluster bacterium]|nr:Holliday junction branch migration protein RuvA [SAR202 cluster bacterium]